MLSVLMADDERVILRGLRKLVNWTQLGLDLIGEVYKGDDLLREIMLHSPDIVITDISMPGMNGIDVLKELKRMDMQTKVIFISAYREFSYAQDALSYGAIDYLIKPIDRKKLEQILIKTVEDIHAATKLEFNNSKLQQYEVKYKRQAITDFLEQITEEKKLSNLPQMIQELEADEADVRFSVIAVEADHPSKHTGSWVEGERKLVYFAIQNILEELLPSGVKGWAISTRTHLYMVVRHVAQFELAPFAMQCHANIGRFLKLSVTVGLGTAGGLERIAESYQEAKISVAYKFFLGNNRVVSIANIPKATAKKEIDREKTEKELLKKFLAFVDEATSSLLDEWFQSIQTVSWGNRDYAVNLCISMIRSAFRECLPLSSGLEMEELRIVQQVNDFETFDEMGQFIRLELEQLRKKMLQKGSNKEMVQIIQVKAYIDEHYVEEINLETMAAQFFMNPYYFSTFFKKHTGQNFKQYVTEVRMKVALQKLSQTDAMLYEIAEQVGYHNARQFSELFKKYYGILPNDYRKSLEER